MGPGYWTALCCPVPSPAGTRASVLPSLRYLQSGEGGVCRGVTPAKGRRTYRSMCHGGLG